MEHCIFIVGPNGRLGMAPESVKLWKKRVRSEQILNIKTNKRNA
jgi:hypothetical protein